MISAKLWFSDSLLLSIYINWHFILRKNLLSLPLPSPSFLSDSLHLSHRNGLMDYFNDSVGCHLLLSLFNVHMVPHLICESSFFWLLYPFHLIPSFLRTFFIAQGVLGLSWTFYIPTYNQAFLRNLIPLCGEWYLETKISAISMFFFALGWVSLLCLPGDGDRWSMDINT